MKNVRPFLMFQGDAEEALRFYTDLINEAEIVELTRYDEGETSGKVKQALFKIKDQEVMCIDSPIPHHFDFTPSFSFFINCDAEDELDHLHQQLSAAGQVLMPPDNYGFSTKFTWISDRFGISWQLNLE